VASDQQGGRGRGKGRTEKVQTNRAKKKKKKKPGGGEPNNKPLKERSGTTLKVQKAKEWKDPRRSNSKAGKGAGWRGTMENRVLRKESEAQHVLDRTKKKKWGRWINKKAGPGGELKCEQKPKKTGCSTKKGGG